MKAENPNSSRNVAQFFVNNRQIAWVALFATLAWGVFGYMSMPKAKVNRRPCSCPWQRLCKRKMANMACSLLQARVPVN